VLGSGDPQLPIPASDTNVKHGHEIRIILIRNVLAKSVAVLRMFNDTMLRFVLGYYMWCDASPSPLKIAELANPHTLSPATR
jgi:hypothetical protein